MNRVDFGLSQHPQMEKERHGFFFIDGEQVPICIRSVEAGRHAAAYLILLAEIGFYEPKLSAEDFGHFEQEIIKLGLPEILPDGSEQENIRAQFHAWDEAVVLAQRTIDMNRVQILLLPGGPILHMMG